MKVSELINLLSSHNAEADVVMHDGFNIENIHIVGDKVCLCSVMNENDTIYNPNIEEDYCLHDDHGLLD